MLVECSKGLNKKFNSIIVWSMLQVYSKISQSSFEASCYKKKNKSAHIETQVSKWVWQYSQDKCSWVLSFPWPHWRPLSQCFSHIYDSKETYKMNELKQVVSVMFSSEILVSCGPRNLLLCPCSWYQVSIWTRNFILIYIKYRKYGRLSMKACH